MSDPCSILDYHMKCIWQTVAQLKYTERKYQLCMETQAHTKVGTDCGVFQKQIDDLETKLIFHNYIVIVTAKHCPKYATDQSNVPPFERINQG